MWENSKTFTIIMVIIAVARVTTPSFPILAELDGLKISNIDLNSGR
jgi:hypothetical protein